MPVSGYKLRDFVDRDSANRRPVIAACRAAGFAITHVESGEDRGKWGLLLKPNERLSTMYRLDREVLLWCTTYLDFQVRDLADMKTFMSKMSDRITRSFAILVSTYPSDKRNSLENESDLDTSIVHCSISDLRPSKSSDVPLAGILSQQLYTRDIYDQPGAITRAAEFFGRRKILDEIADEVVTGQSQVGIFGMRKVGKTSLINRLAQVAVQSGKCIVVKLDLQLTTSVSPNAEYTLWSLGEALYASSSTIRRMKRLRLFGQYAMASDAASSGSLIWELFAHDINIIISSTSRRIVVVFDEIERIFTREDDFVRLWRLLRGLDQQHPNRLRYVISGTSPECAEDAFVGKHDNPLYQYLSLRYLGPLSQEDTYDLLSKLGGYIGLRWEPSALEYAYDQSGGHPALTRILGSVAHKNLLPRSDFTNISREIARSAAADVLSKRPAVLAQVIASLKDRYPDEYVLIEALSQGDIAGFREMAREFPNELSHLDGYGLLPEGSHSSRLSMAMLQTYIDRDSQKRPLQSAKDPLDIRGEKIGEWEVVSKLSAGGYADVYLGKNEAGDSAAIKIFRAAQLSSLEREVEFLQTLDHPAIVKLIEASRTKNGAPCLIMDHIQGKPLSDYCDPTHSLDSGELREVANGVLQALIYMHPDSKKAAGLQTKDELSVEELSLWELSRHGIIHRDIKPENIILSDSGPVLIDFNIAVRAADPVLTLSATPGYLPPTFDGINWTPTVDLYQLGVTLSQLAACMRYNVDNIADLLQMAGARHGSSLISWIRRLTECQFDSAREAQAALPRLR